MMMLFQAILGVLIAARLVDVAPTEQHVSEFVCINKVCYAIFWTNKKYQGASRACGKLNGQLMTVRSSVEAEAISILMGTAQSSSARVWIGLEQPDSNKCTDTSAPLRGFTWVTGDSNTDYMNWKNDGAKCGHLCVSVHKDLSWEETDCSVKTDGYLCEVNYPESCAPIYLPEGYSVTYHTPLGTIDNGATLLPPGSYAMIPEMHTPLLCDDHGTGVMSWSSEEPGAWNCMVENGGCEFICNLTNLKCECAQDQQLKDDGRSCSKPCDPNPCDQHCIPHSSGFICMCAEGYNLTGDGKTCQDIDDCASNPNICEHICMNTEGSFVCSCKPGYEMVDGQCEDIDECSNPKTLCEHSCRNYPGGFRCHCDEGYVTDEINPTKCKRFCNTTECAAECDPNNPDVCECPEGYLVDTDNENMAVCADVDECDSGHCKHLCINLPGTFECACPEGYTLQGDSSCLSDEGSGLPEVPSEIPPSKPSSPDIHALQPIMLLGICVGILSMLTVIIAIICHMVRKHHMDHASMDFKCKGSEKGVVLQQVKSTSQQKL
ncbi:thrombomodulin [Rhinophrynus dorsalis]